MRRLAALAAVAVVVLASGCSAFSSGDASGGDAPVRIATFTTLDLLDPTRSTNDDALGDIFNALVEKSPDGKAVPGVATSWTPNADNTVWTFRLRPGVTFQDGSPLDSTDVVFTYRKILADKTSTVAAYTRGITKVEAQGPDTVVFTLARPTLFAENGARVWIVPSDYYTAVGPDGFRQKPIGSGPYRVTAITAGPTVALEAFDAYWRGPAQVKKAELTYITDENTIITGLQSGAIDVARISPRGQQSLQGGGVTLSSGPSNQTFYLGFNFKNPLLADIRFRQAVSLAVDRAAITTNLFAGLAQPIGQMLPAVTSGYDPSITAPAADPAKAKALLAEMGYAGQPVRLDYPSADAIPQGEEVVQAVARDLQNVGIAVTPKGTDSAAYLKTWYVGGFEGLHIYAYTSATASRAYSLLANAATYDTAPVLSRLAAAEAQPDAAKQAQGLDTIARMLADQVDYAPLFNPKYTYASTSRVTAPVRTDGYLRPYEMTVS